MLTGPCGHLGGSVQVGHGLFRLGKKKNGDLPKQTWSDCLEVLLNDDNFPMNRTIDNEVLAHSTLGTLHGM